MHNAQFIRTFQQISRTAFVMIVMAAFVLIAQCAGAPELVFSHSLKELKPCPVPSIDQKDKLVGAGFDLIAEKYWRTFDLNTDRRSDFHIEYDIKGVREDKTLILTPFPSTYYVDTDDDGTYDKIWIDMQGNGKCEDLRPFTGRETH